MTPLMFAAAAESAECVDTLLDHSVCTKSINLVDHSGKTALHHGASNKHIVKRLLSAGANPLYDDAKSKTPFQVAEEMGADDAAKLIWESQNPNALSQAGVPRLLEAVQSGNRAAAEALLSRGANPDKKGEASSFPLHEAAADNSSGGELVELLLRWGASPNKVDDNRRSPLHVAASSGNGKAVKALLDASINKRDEIGQTPLHAAVRARSVAVVRVLLRAGASAFITDDAGNKQSDICDEHEICQLLSQRVGSTDETEL